MKKILLLSFLIASTFAANANELNTGLSKFGRWSVAADAGFTRYDGDLQPRYDYMGILMSPNFGISLEYNLNPNFSLGWNVGGMYFNQDDADETFTSGGMFTSAYLSTDLLSLFRGKKSKLVGFWLSGGLGIGGTYLPTYTTTRAHEPALIPKTNGVVYAPTFVIIPITLNLEFNLSKQYSLGLMGRLFYSNTDQIESVYRHEYNDMWETGGISLRYKFVTKDKKHFRDEEFEVLEPSSITLITLIQNDLGKLGTKVDGLDGKIGMLEKRVEKVEGILSNDGLDSDQDGIPDVRDLEPSTPRGNAVDFWGRTIGEKSIVNQSLLSVYFDFDSSVISQIAQTTLIKVAEKMKDNPAMLLEIRGYTDSPGSHHYNQKLSQQRAESVKAELMKSYGIPSNRMVANGKGMVAYPPSETIRNRRCDFFFSE